MKNNDTFVKINIPNKWVPGLAEEFGVSQQAIRNALYHLSNSDNAKAIRRRAKELLQREVEKIKD